MYGEILCIFINKPTAIVNITLKLEEIEVMRKFCKFTKKSSLSSVLLTELTDFSADTEKTSKRQAKVLQVWRMSLLRTKSSTRVVSP